MVEGLPPKMKQFFWTPDGKIQEQSLSVNLTFSMYEHLPLFFGFETSWHIDSPMKHFNLYSVYCSIINFHAYLCEKRFLSSQTLSDLFGTFTTLFLFTVMHWTFLLQLLLNFVIARII